MTGSRTRPANIKGNNSISTARHVRFADCVGSAERRLLFISNGHGEDAIAVRLIDVIRGRSPLFEIHGWPMVGGGDAYREHDVPTVGTRNLLPSEGFATVSARLMWHDLKSGWITTHLTQLRTARTMRGKYDMAVVVGDVVPILAATLAQLPFFFVGCAKSSHYDARSRYTPLETWLLRRGCVRAFPRDSLTARALERARVPVRFAGNPMMDGLESREPLEVPDGVPVVALLPGSHRDAEENAVDLVAVARAVAAATPPDRCPRFYLAPARAFDLNRFCRLVQESDSSWVGLGASHGRASACPSVRLTHRSGAIVDIVTGRFADVLHRATIVIGLAGTANEQAVGLGRPLVTFPSRGAFGHAYVRMKMQLFGEAAIATEPNPASVARAAVDILNDPVRRARMSEFGRARMGGPGASEAIAEEVCVAAPSTDAPGYCHRCACTIAP